MKTTTWSGTLKPSFRVLGACPAPMWKIHMEGRSIFIHIPPSPTGILPKKKYKQDLVFSVKLQL